MSDIECDGMEVTRRERGGRGRERVRKKTNKQKEERESSPRQDLNCECKD